MTVSSGSWCCYGLLIVIAAGFPAESRAQSILTAVKTKTPPVLDGRIDATEWDAAATVNEFVQFEPQRGQRSPLRTEARLLYDDQNIYIALPSSSCSTATTIGGPAITLR